MLDATVNAHLRGAISAMQEIGSFAPTLWAQADRIQAIAVPRSQRAARLEDADRVWILAWMADAIEAEIIGRSDEVWSKSYPAGSLPDLNPGDIGMLASSDPEVRTALTVQACEIRSKQIGCGIALPSIGDLGEQEWEISSPAIVGGSSHDGLLAAARLCSMIERDRSSSRQRLARLAPLIDNLGWHLGVVG